MVPTVTCRARTVGAPARPRSSSAALLSRHVELDIWHPGLSIRRNENFMRQRTFDLVRLKSEQPFRPPAPAANSPVGVEQDDAVVFGCAQEEIQQLVSHVTPTTEL